MSSTHDTDALDEKIRDEVIGIYGGHGYYSTFIGTDEAAEITADVLPIIAEEVRKAKAEAWEEGYDAAEINEHEHRPGRKLTNPYTAQRHQTHKEQE